MNNVDEVFNELFHELDTYEVIPLMLEKVSNEVARSEFDTIKEHSICYHISGMVDIAIGLKNALKVLENEIKILDVDIAAEIDEDQYRKFLILSELLKSFNNEKSNCLHEGSTVIKKLENGYFILKCPTCNKIYIDG